MGPKKPDTTDIIPMESKKYPRREDIVGDAGLFVDDFIQAIGTEQIYRVMGVNPDKAFLITGSPGNGKTMAIETLVNEINRNIVDDLLSGKTENKSMTQFKLLGFKYDTGRYGTAYINEGPKIIQNFFDVCFGVANYGVNSLVIFDEAENLFGRRQDSRGHKEDDKNIETIMKNIQALHYIDNAYVVMMSNFPEAFDEASIRSGRVDRKIEFKNPTDAEREFAYKQGIHRLNERAGYSVIRSYDTSELAKLSGGFSYSDVIESINSAVKQKAKETSSKKNVEIIDLNVWITQKGLKESIEKHRDKFVKKRESRKIGFLV